MYPRRTTTSGFGGGFGGCGSGGPIPRDLAVLLGVLFVTYSLQFFAATQIVPALLRLTPPAWHRALGCDAAHPPSSRRFFAPPQIVPALLRLTPLAWQRGFVWQLATYPFVGYGSPSLWFVLELPILYMFGNELFFGIGRAHLL